MKAPRSIGFNPPRAAWLLGHPTGAGGRVASVAMLVLATAALAAAAWHWTQRAAASAVAPAAAVAAVAPAASVPLPGAADRARINRVVRRLNTPWSTIFEALENQATPRVAVLALETDADRGAVRVQTEGPSLDELLQHAERVQSTSPFVRTRLLRIEPPDAAGAPAGITRLSFDLVIEP